MLYLLLLPLMAAFVVRALPDRWRLPGFIGTLCTVFAGTLAICFHPVSLSLPGICGLGAPGPPWGAPCGRWPAGICGRPPGIAPVWPGRGPSSC